MAGRPKTKSERDDWPGPANYVPKVPASGGDWSFGTAQRGAEHGTAPRVPGPGEYNPPRPGFTPAATIPKADRKPLLQTDAPGPAHYDPQPALAHTPAFGFSTAEERGKGADAVPGPGEYQTATRSKTPEWSFSNFKRVLQNGAKKFAPGPGSYYPVQPTGPRGISMTPRRKAKEKKSATAGSTEMMAARTQFG